MVDDVFPCPVQTLVAHLDELFSDAWTVGPCLAVHRIGSGQTFELLSVDEPVEVALRRLPSPNEADLVGLSALGWSGRDEALTGERERVRLTVVASCCQVAAVLRMHEGSVVPSRATGTLIAALRGWAGLAQCCCKAA